MLKQMIKREIKERKEDEVDYDLDTIISKFEEYGYTENEIIKAYKEATK